MSYIAEHSITHKRVKFSLRGWPFVTQEDIDFWLTPRVHPHYPHIVSNPNSWINVAMVRMLSMRLAQQQLDGEYE